MGNEGPILAALFVLAIAVAYWWLMRKTGDGARDPFRPTCPRCGYDLRVPTQRCPECGDDVPEGLQFRARLMAGEAPEWMRPGSPPLPLREPGQAEPWVQVAANREMRQVRAIQALLDRAGITSRAGLSLWPQRTDFPEPGKVDSVFGVVEVCQVDAPLARELAIYVTWRAQEGSLAQLEADLGVEGEEARAEPDREP